MINTGHASRLRLVWECFLLLVLLKMTLGGTGFSDDVSHILVGVRHGRCARAMEGGFEIRVLHGVNTRSVAGSGCESLQGSVPLDSRMGTDHGICPWVSI